MHSTELSEFWTASNILILFVQCERKYWNIRISAPAHYKWPEWPGDCTCELVTGYGTAPPRRPNINSFVSSWWKSPLRQHFWPSEQLVNSEPSRYYWAIIKIFSSNEESYRRQDDLIIKWSASVSRPILVGNSNIYSLISKEMVSLFLARLNKQSITVFLFL